MEAKREAEDAEFVKFFEELAGDDVLDTVREEYEKLQRALRRSRESESRLTRRCEDLKGQITSNEARVETAVKLSVEDQATIQHLRHDMERTWTLIEEARKRDTLAKKEIQETKSKIGELQRKGEEGTKESLEEERSIASLVEKRDQLTQAGQLLASELVGLRRENIGVMDQSKLMESELDERRHDLAALKDEIAQNTKECNALQREKRRLEADRKAEQTSVDEKQQLLARKKGEVAVADESIVKAESQLREARIAEEKALKDFQSLEVRQQKMEQDFKEQRRTTNELMANNDLLSRQVARQTEMIAEGQKNAARVAQEKQEMLAKREALQRQKAVAEAKRDVLKRKIEEQLKENEVMRRNLMSLAKVEEDLDREKDLLTKKLVKTQSSTLKVDDLLKIMQGTKKSLETEIMVFKSEAQKQRKEMYQLEKMKEKYRSSAAKADATRTQAEDEQRIRDETITEQQQKVLETERRLKQQKAMYDSVRSDRNLYSKNLVESQNEVSAMKRKFMIMNHQISTLKEEIAVKDAELVRNHFEHMKVEKEKESVSAENELLKKNIHVAKQLYSQQVGEAHSLKHVIEETDAERSRQKKEFQIVVNERDILGSQLIRRNDELAKLYEKIKINQNQLKRGETAYRRRLREIMEMKKRVNDKRSEMDVLRSNVHNVDDLRTEVYRLERELLHERAKVKALQDELRNPMNIHRWRKLEGSDPDAFRLIRRMQRLQKVLIRKVEEVKQNDLHIQEQEKTFVELKNLLARQPGTEVAQQLALFQANAKDKRKQMKAMKNELKMYQDQVKEYEFAIGQLKEEAKQLRETYCQQKKKEQKSGVL